MFNNDIVKVAADYKVSQDKLKETFVGKVSKFIRNRKSDIEVCDIGIEVLEESKQEAHDKLVQAETILAETK